MHRHRTGNIWRLALCLALGVAITQIAASPGAAQPPTPEAKEPSVDYWQPLWMQRELWGPGTMPPGMRARLLRQTTYMQYGVQKDYQGAKSTVANNKETIEAGGKLYGEKCASCHGKQGLGDGQAPRSLLLAGAAGLHDPAAGIGRRIPALEHFRGRQAIRHGDARLQGRARARGHLEDRRLHARRFSGGGRSSAGQVDRWPGRRSLVVVGPDV